VHIIILDGDTNPGREGGVSYPEGSFYEKICTNPTSCEFDLKSATCSQMTKSTSCEKFPPKEKDTDSQTDKLADLQS
jgi:hypothetical protein